MSFDSSNKMTRQLVLAILFGVSLTSKAWCCSAISRHESGSVKGAQCLLDLDKRVGEVNPMILDDQNNIIYPLDRVMTFDDGSLFGLYCHSSEKKVNQLSVTDTNGNPVDQVTDYVLVTCDKGEYKVGTQAINLLTVTCVNRMEPRISKVFTASKPCADTGADGRKSDLSGNLHIINIGFQIRDSYLKQIEICTDEKSYGTLWTKHRINGVSINENDRNERPDFKTDTSGERRFYNFTSSTGLDRMYISRYEAAAVTQILGTDTLPDGREIVVVNSGTRSFNRGHITPDADFVMDYQQDATYYFLNVAPQFGSFNQKNWLFVESACRDKSFLLGRTTDVISGTFGMLQYPSSEEVPTSLYLDPNIEKKSHRRFRSGKAKGAGDSSDGGTAVIPIPKYYWKVLYDKESHRATTFLGMNDIYHPDIVDTPCPSVCDQLDWIDFDYEDESLGHITCCDMETFSAVVSYAPDLRNKDGEWPALLL